MKGNHRTIAVACLITISGCGGLFETDRPADRVYMLAPFAAAESTVAPEAKRSLSISVTATPGLDTDRILVIRSGSRLDRYEGAQWQDHIPDVVESIAKQSFESTGQYSWVADSRAPSGLIGDWIWKRDSSMSSDPRPSPPSMYHSPGYVSCDGYSYNVGAVRRVVVSDDNLRAIVAGHEEALHWSLGKIIAQTSLACAKSSPAPQRNSSIVD